MIDTLVHHTAMKKAISSKVQGDTVQIPVKQRLFASNITSLHFIAIFAEILEVNTCYLEACIG